MALVAAEAGETLPRARSRPRARPAKPPSTGPRSSNWPHSAPAAKRQGVRLASRAAQDAPEYLKGLLSWRDQLKKGRLTIYLDTSAVNRQLDQLRGITATLVVGVLVGAAMIASTVAEVAFQQHGPHWLVNAARIAFVASLAVAAVLVINYLGQMFRRRRQNQRK